MKNLQKTIKLAEYKEGNTMEKIVNGKRYIVTKGTCLQCQMEHDSKGCLGRNGICSVNSRDIFLEV